MKLTVIERIVVSRFLPFKANYELLAASERITKPSLAFNEEESRLYDIKGQKDDINIKGGDLAIVNAARVSFLGESKGEDQDKRQEVECQRNHPQQRHGCDVR